MMTLPDIPRLYTALAEWLACMVYVLALRPRFGRGATILIGAGWLLGMGVFLQLTGHVPIVWWIPCMTAAVAAMYLLLLLACEIPALDAGYCCARAFILAEFAASLEWQILNRLLEHRNFPKLIDLIRIYFQDTAAKGITARNQLIEIATASLSDLMKEHPEHRAEAKQDLQLLNAQKMGEHEAEIEKIKNVFLAILRDIKKDIDNGEQPGEAVTAAMFQAMRDALAEQKQKPAFH